MSTEIGTGFSQKFASNVELKLQQRPSRLRGACRVGNYRGSKQAQVVQQLGATAAVLRTTRHGDTPLMNTPHDARWIFPSDYLWADLIDREDEIKTLADFQSPYAENAAAAMNRAIDDVLIAAMFSDTTKTGETGGTTTDWTTFVAANTGHKVSSSSVGLTVAKLRAAKKALMIAEVDLDNDMIFCAIGGKQHDDLLTETQIVNLDYNTRPVLADGKITSFMGINFIHTERLATVSSEYRVPVWAKSGLALGIWNDVTGKVSERNDKSHATQVFASLTVGGTRVEEKKFVELLCA